MSSCQTWGTNADCEFISFDGYSSGDADTIVVQQNAAEISDIIDGIE